MLVIYHARVRGGFCSYRSVGLGDVKVWIWPPERNILQAIMDLTTGRASITHVKAAYLELDPTSRLLHRIVRVFLAGCRAEFLPRGMHLAKLIEQAKDTPRLRQAKAYLAAGNSAKAEELARAEAGARNKQVAPQAVLAHILWQCGKKKEATETLNKLREMSADLELDAKIFRRLAPIAQELKLPADWRAATKPANDLGDRPSLENLGPFRWSPTPAAAWKLPDSQGKSLSLSDYRGKPVVLIFYLGSGCVHCTEQLATFAPMTREFADAGISIIGISTDNVSDLKLSVKPGPDGSPFPFPIVSDDKLTAFHAYRCFDDFENKTLHGTFVIDGQGLIRWHDISYQPFMDAKFVLGEAKRLLALPSPGASKTQVSR